MQWALSFASRMGHVDVLKALLRHGADVMQSGTRGLTALHVSEENAWDFRSPAVLLWCISSCSLSESYFVVEVASSVAYRVLLDIYMQKEPYVV